MGSPDKSELMMQPLEYGAPISLSEAKRVVEAAQAEAASNNWAMVIAVCDSGGHLVVLHKMDHAQFGSVTLAQAKARTAVGFKRPSKAFEDAVESGGRDMRVLSMEGVCPLEGGVLLLENDRIIGAIGVSGAHPTQDTQVAMAGVRVLDG